MTEKELQRVVIDCAHLFGWICAHFRPALTGGRWTTPVSADGAGFPDLVMARNGEIVIAELKGERGKLSETQKMWLAALSTPDLTDRRLRCYVWNPADWINGSIEAALR